MTDNETQQTAATETVGRQLKQAREKKGLSLSDVADAQHLRNGVIQAIENCDYEQVDSELFLKGYVRAYAKQVGLDSNAIIADLNKELEPGRQQKARELEANPLVSIERKKRQKRRIGKLLFLTVAAVLVGVLVVMFILPRFNIGQGIATPSTEPTLEQQSEGEGSTVNSDLDDSLTQNSYKPSSEPTPDTASSDAVEPDSNVATGETAGADTAEQQIPVVVQSTDPVLAQPPVSSQPDPELGQLEIAFTGDCWVQVQDATGSRLASSLKRSGDRLVVSGKAPLKVVIGAVDTVDTIRFQGELVNIADFPVDKNRSEFTLPI